LLLIVRAPVRISFGGGGTDLPAYYEQFGGAVVNTAINRYIYTVLSTGSSDALQIISSDFSKFYRHDDDSPLTINDDLGLAKAILREFGNYQGLDLFLASQVPPGTGLGSSGAVAVAMVKALSTWQGQHLSHAEIAEIACDIAINKMGLPSGKQDEYGSAMGGLNHIVFEKSGVTVAPVKLTPETLATLQRRVMLFYTGQSRNSGAILKKQTDASKVQNQSTLEKMHQIKALGGQMLSALEAGDLDAFGDLLHQSWLQKRGVVQDVSNDTIDQAYQLARENGALGGKIAGAGGGGFMMIYANEEKQPAITAALKGLGLNRMDFEFDLQGPQVLLHQP
jgi:D-glycero-alpha-D-manno-heptose-7-phosphate kinase